MQLVREGSFDRAATEAPITRPRVTLASDAADDAEIARETTRLRKRFQLLEEDLRARARAACRARRVMLDGVHALDSTVDDRITRHIITNFDQR